VFRRTVAETELSLLYGGSDIRSFVEDGSGTVWGSGVGSLLERIDGPASMRPPNEMPPGVNGSSLLFDRDGGLWVATLGDGLIHLAGNAGARRYKGEAALTSDVVRCLLQDREGNIWAGTQNGLNRLSKSLVTSLPEPGDGMGRLVRAVTAAKDNVVWVATGTGLYQFSGSVRRRFDALGRLPGGVIVALHSDASGQTWVATHRSVGRLIDGRFREHPAPPGVQYSRISALTTDTKRNLWVCDIDQGVIHLRDSERIAVPREAESDSRTCFSIYADTTGRVWAGFLDGTLRMFDGSTVTSYTQRDGLIGGLVATIYEDREHTIWIGSSNGLSRFRDGRIDAIGWSSGLPGNIVGALEGDDSGNLWLGVSSGIVKLAADEFEQRVKNPGHRLQYTLYDASDGLRGDPIGLGNPTVAATRDGTLWFVTSDGLALVDVQHVVRNRKPPSVSIEQAIADDRPVLLTPRVALPPHTGRLQINFTALSFTAPQKVAFRYRLNGYDRDWIDGGVARQAVYTNLQPATYTFQISASNDGVTSEAPAEWEFSITPSFYQTAWFPASICAIIGLALTGIWRLRVHQVKQRFSAILVERARVARELHDTLLQSLSGVAIRLDNIAATVSASPRMAERHLHTLRQQVEFYVREARQSIRDLRSPVLETQDLGTALRGTGERITSGQPVAFELRVTGKARRAEARTEEHLLRIGQEAISNAVQHGKATRIRVELNYTLQSVALRVVDDGKGFDVAGSSHENHWGLTSMQERAEQIEATFQLTTEPGLGTTIHIEAPLLSRSHRRGHRHQRAS
jgi:signal transduction histidine kinase/ligand-binding sensor domain-containing protein